MEAAAFNAVLNAAPTMTLGDDPAAAEPDARGQDDHQGQTAITTSAEVPASPCVNTVRNGSGNLSRNGSRTGSRGSRGSHGSRNGSRGGSRRGGSRGSRGSFSACPYGANGGEEKRPNTSDGQCARPPRPWADSTGEAVKGVAHRPVTVAAVSTAASTTCLFEDPFPPPPTDGAVLDVDGSTQIDAVSESADVVGEVDIRPVPVGDGLQLQNAGTNDQVAHPGTGVLAEDEQHAHSDLLFNPPDIGTCRPKNKLAPLDFLSQEGSAGSEGFSHIGTNDFGPSLSQPDSPRAGDTCDSDGDSDGIGRRLSLMESTHPPLPILERLCGRCSPLPINDCHPRFPSKVGFKKLKSTKPKKWTARELKKLLAKKKHTNKSWDDLVLPEELERSFFSRQPHARLPFLTCAKGFELEVGILQHKVKWPIMKDVIEHMGATAFTERVREMREDCERSTLRLIVGKPMHHRSFEESVHLIGYLRKRLFFRDLSITVLNEITKHLKILKYPQGGVIYTKGKNMSGIFILLKGVVAFPDEVQVKATEKAPKTPPYGSEGDESPTRRRRRSAVVHDEHQLFIEEEHETLDVKINEVSNDEVSGGGNVIGVSELLDDHHWPVPPRTTRVHLSSAVACNIVEAIFLPADKLLPLLEEEALREKIAVLQEWFPPTKGWQEKILNLPSRVERDGKRLPIHALFDISNLARNTVMHQGGERLPLDVARVSVVITGQVNFKARWRLVDTGSDGVVLGEEALRGEAYAHTVMVSSPRAKIMSIKVCDYITQFEHGRMQNAQLDKSSTQYTLQQNDEIDDESNRPDNNKAEPIAADIKTNETYTAGQRSQRRMTSMKDTKAKIAKSHSVVAAHLFSRDSTKVMDNEIQKYHPKRMPQRVAPIENSALQKHWEEDLTDESTVRRRFMRRTMDKLSSMTKPTEKPQAGGSSRKTVGAFSDDPETPASLLHGGQMLARKSTPPSSARVIRELGRKSTPPSSARVLREIARPSTSNAALSRASTRGTIIKSGGFHMHMIKDVAAHAHRDTNVGHAAPITLTDALPPQRPTTQTDRHLHARRSTGPGNGGWHWHHSGRPGTTHSMPQATADSTASTEEPTYAQIKHRVLHVHFS